MKIQHFEDSEVREIKAKGVRGVVKRVLIGASDGAPNFTMRLFHVDPGGYTFHHSHDFEHEIFIIEGKGEVVTTQGIRQIKKNYVLYIPPGEEHQVRNTGKSRLSFLCLVPNENEL